ESRLELAKIFNNHLKNTDNAIRTLSDAVALRGDKPELYIALATLHESKSQLKEGIRILTQASKKFKENEQILFALGTFLDKAGDFEGGISIMKEVIRINPNNAHALNHIGYG